MNVSPVGIPLLSLVFTRVYESGAFPPLAAGSTRFVMASFWW